MAGTFLFDTNIFVNLLFGLAKLLLQAAEELVFLAFFVGEVVVIQLTVLLFGFTFQLVPITLDFVLYSTHVSLVLISRTSGCLYNAAQPLVCSFTSIYATLLVRHIRLGHR